MSAGKAAVRGYNGTLGQGGVLALGWRMGTAQGLFAAMLPTGVKPCGLSQVCHSWNRMSAAPWAWLSSELSLEMCKVCGGTVWEGGRKEGIFSTPLVWASSLDVWVLYGVLLQGISGLSQNLRALFLAVTGRVEGIMAGSTAAKWLTSVCPRDPGPLCSDPH